MSGAMAEVVDEIRARIRTSGLDLNQDNQQVLHLVEDVVGGQSASRATDIIDQVAGFGALQQFFDDDTVEEIWINEPGRIFVARVGKSELTPVVMTAHEVRSIVERMLSSTGRRLDISNPFVDATLTDGSRLHVAIPDITRGHWAVNIRKFSAQTHSLESLIQKRTLTEQAATFLQACVVAGLNIVVAGATQAGKTTLMNALLNSAPAYERIITCEEVFELKLQSPDWIALQARQASLDGAGEITLRRLIKEALRMRPSRLVVGEVRQEECLDLLIAMNSGMPSMCSLHANSARAALAKMCLLPMLAGNNVSAEFVVPTVATVVDIVVHIALEHDGHRQVQSIASVTGRCEGNMIEMGEVFALCDGWLMPTGIFPSQLELFAAHDIDLAALLGSTSWA
jgi:pilus assembly protein CpaF